MFKKLFIIIGIVIITLGLLGFQQETVPEWGKCTFKDKAQIEIIWRVRQDYIKPMESGILTVGTNFEFFSYPIELTRYDERTNTYHYSGKFPVPDNKFFLEATINFNNGGGIGYWMVRPLQYIPKDCGVSKNNKVFIPMILND